MIHFVKCFCRVAKWGVLLTAITCTPVVEASNVVQITVHPEKPGGVIPTDFLGLSYEKSRLAEKHFYAGNMELLNLCGNLGVGVLRFGGNKVETTYWQSSQPAAARTSKDNVAATVGPLDLKNLYDFTRQSGWRVIYGLNLAATNYSMVSDEATYAAKAGGAAVLLAFEVGNEPDYYPKHELRSSGYSYREYAAEAEAEQCAVRAAVPTAKFAGPATTRRSEWFENFVGEFKGRLALATYHYYSLSSKSRDRRSVNFASVENLLSGETKRAWVSAITQKQQAARSAGMPLRIAECNSVSNGGTEGVSDVFASALWGADLLFDAAEQGVAGINFHGGFGEHGYMPIGFRANHYQACPLYYAMLLFHQAGQGRVVPVDDVKAVSVTVHGVLGNDDKLRVVVINKDLIRAHTVAIRTGLPTAVAEAIRLLAPSVNARGHITLAGSEVQTDGTWTPQTNEIISGVDGLFEFSLPAASAALLSVAPTHN